MASDELRNRRRSIESDRAAGRAPNSTIAASWSRCEPVLDVGQRVAPVALEPEEARERWADSPIRRSGIGVEEQLGRTAEAGDLIAAITDPEGTILWTHGGRGMRRIADRVGFVEGGRWDEASAGTNALALAVLTGKPSTVFSSEHWCESVQNWVCWSVPVNTPDGRMVGVLDLSGRWSSSTPVAELAVAAMARLVEEHLPSDVVDTAVSDEIHLQLLGHPVAMHGGRALPLSPRQVELLAALAIEGPSSLERLHELVYGDRPVSLTTLKAELSHMRRLLGGGIASRPYRLTVPVRVDVLELRRMLHVGDLHGASAAYDGQLLPDSDAPFAVDQRHVIDVALRRSLLEAGTVDELLHFAEVHRFDETVLEEAVDRAGANTPLQYEARARLDLARRG